MITNEYLFSLLDMVGTFGFAVSGAMAAKENKLDLFGLAIVAFLTAYGGGIIRDICLRISPPIGISYWPYLALTLFASLLVVFFYSYISKIKYSILLFDAIGLSLFAVAGAQKALFLNYNYEVAILLGILSAIGGGIIRDLLLGRIPVVLRKEVYGSAACIASLVVVVFDYFDWSMKVGAWLGILICFLIRYFSIKNKWNLPRV